MTRLVALSQIGPRWRIVIAIVVAISLLLLSAAIIVLAAKKFCTVHTDSVAEMEPPSSQFVKDLHLVEHAWHCMEIRKFAKKVWPFVTEKVIPAIERERGVKIPSL